MVDAFNCEIGPEIDPQGLERIKSYVGKRPEPANFANAAAILQRLFGTLFPKLGEEDWTKYARRTFKDADGRLVPDYDVKLGAILTEVDLDKPLPTMWKEFDALAHLPVMVIRGGNSDILSAATVAAMQARHPALQVVEVPDQGHAPLLAETDVIGRIAKFVAACAGRLIRRTIPSQCRITARFTKEGPPAVARRGLEVEPKIARSGDHG